MTYLDHDASHRLGQRPVPGTTLVTRVATDLDRPANPHHGLVVFVEDTLRTWIWNDTLDVWEPIAGGIEFYAQDDPPTTAGYAAFWLDTLP